MTGGKLDLEDLDNDRKFSPRKAYGDAKLENILFTTELHRRFHDQGLSAVAFHPGSVATSFATQSDSAMRFVYNSSLARRFLTTPEQGAKQLVWLATGTDWHSGGYYEKGKPSTKKNPQAKDAELARRLWERSAELVGLPVKP